MTVPRSPREPSARHDGDGLRQPLSLDGLEDAIQRLAPHHHVHTLATAEQLLRQEVQGRGPVALGDEEAVREALRVREAFPERADHLQELVRLRLGQPLAARPRRVDHELERAGPPSAA